MARPPPSSEERRPPLSVVRGMVRGEASPAIAQNAVALYGPFGLPALPPRAASWRRRRRGRGAKRRSAGGGTALGPDSRQFRGDDDGGAEGRNHRENHSAVDGDF